MIEVKNKFEKFLISLVGILTTLVFILGIKIKSEDLKREKLESNLKEDFLNEELFTTQKEIEKDRAEIMSEIINSPEEKIVEEVVSTTTTPPPPPPVKEVVKKKSDKKTKSS